LLLTLLGCAGGLSSQSLRRDLPWVRSVEFVGNTAISSGTLRSLMLLKAPSLVHPFRRSYYLRDLLSRDVGDITDAYRDRGYLAFHITRIEEDIDEERRTVKLVMHIDEGPRTYVRYIRFGGNLSLTERDLAGAIKSREGEPYSPFVSQADAERARVRYLNEGHLLARVDRRVIAGADSVDLEFQVSEGPMTRLRSVSATGNDRTRDHPIVREMPIEIGDPVTREKLLETQRRLGELRLFSLARPRATVADSTTGVVDVEIAVRERKHGRYGFGTGFSSDERLRVSAEWGHRNIWGAARRLTVQGTLGWDVDSLLSSGDSDSEREASVTWGEPWVFGTRTQGNFSLYHEFERKPLAFEYTTNGVRAAFGRELSRYVDLFLTLENEWTSSDDTTFAQSDFTSRSVQLEFERDSRDNILDPRRGAIQRVLVEYAGVEGAKNYLKSLASTAHAVPQTSFRDRLVAGRIEIGYIEPVGENGESGDDVTLIPYQDRYFIGGATSLRGYRREQVGPLGGDGISRGGTVLLLANVEYRFPIVWKIAGGLFLDAGNVWGSIDDLKPSRIWGEFTGVYDTKDVRVSAGFGLRFQTPVGPFRVDYAQKLGNAREEDVFDSLDEFHFSLGHAF
jgi:outer membrane protein assembly complex protein YaeT